jgi:hypothetical protein
MIVIHLPIYYTQEFSKKKPSTILVGDNWFRNAHYYLKNQVKQHYHELVAKELNGLEARINSEYRVRYKYYYKTSTSDMMNVGSRIDKFLNDALQEIGIVENDNVKFYTFASFEVGGLDKDNPRMECYIEERNTK